MKSQKTITREGDVELLVTESLILDLGLRCSVDVERDLRYVQHRFRREGHSFLYLGLPKLATFLEATLGNHEVSLPEGFALSGGAQYPRFLSGFWRQVMKPDGTLLQDPSPDCIFAIRQIGRAWKKIQVPSSDQAVREALDGYVSTDRALGRHQPPWRSDLYRLYTHVGDVLWASSLAELDHQAGDFSLEPRHGSGATADRLVGNRKYQLSSWYRQLDGILPFTSYLVPDLGTSTRDLVKIDDRSPVVRVTTVPKTIDKPRIIAIEPTAMQYAQQAVMRGVYDAVQSTWLAGHIGFRDQTRNQRLAKLGSEGRGFATLDLSEASDRVHPHYVARLFRKLPNLRRAIFATRSPYADVPGYGVRRLAKFASMGSATCFPIEGMHFYTIVLASILKQQSWPSWKVPTERKLRSISRGVSVFGDDMVVPEPYAEQLVKDLEAFGLKVNRSKSFLEGRFRESCGEDYFDGYTVKPTYIRHEFPTSISDGGRICSWVATANLFYEAGLWLTSEVIQCRIEELTGKLPFTSSDLVKDQKGVEGFRSSGLAWFSNQDIASQPFHRLRWCKDLHIFLVKTWVPQPRMQEDPLSGYGALMKFFLSRRIETFDPENLWTTHLTEEVSLRDHLDQSPKPYSAKLRQKWVKTGHKP